MKKIGSSRRGLSTIVATGIMLGAVAVLGSAVVGWSNSNLKIFETTLSNTATSSTNKITEGIAIENVAFCSNCGSIGNKNFINVTLTNTGTVGVTINQIQINSTIINTYLPGTTLPANILPQKSYLVAAQLSTQWHSKSVDTITVITSRGSTFTTQAAPP